MFPVNIYRLKLKISFFGQQITQPILKLLIALFLLFQMKICTNYIMTGIINSPNHISMASVGYNSTISQCTYILANHLRVAVVVFKLHPTCFIGQFAQLQDKFIQVFHIGHFIRLEVSNSTQSYRFYRE